jgi:hypothetical protein
MPQGKQRSNKPKKGNNKGNNKPKGKSDQKGNNKQNKKRQEKIDLYDPRTTLSGDTLKKFVKSQVRNQIRPEISANKRTVQTLKKLLSGQTDQLRKFDKQATGNIEDYYQDLAKGDKQATATSEALGSRLTGALGSQGVQTAGTIQNAADAATGALDADQALRQDSSNSARAELQQIIAMQQGNAATESQALQGKGAMQANSWSNLMQGMGQANQMRGAATLADIHQGTQTNIADLQNQYAPDLREAIGNIKEIRKSKGDIRNELLAQLRGDERQYLLSKGALGIDKESLKSDLLTAKQERKAAKKSKTGNPTLDVAKQYGKNKKQEQLRTLQNQLKVIKAQSGAKAREQQKSLENQIAVIQAQQSGKGGGAGKGYTRDEFLRAKDLANARLNLDQIKSKEAYVDSIATLVNGGVNSKAARAYLKKKSPYGRRLSSKDAPGQGGTSKPDFY